MKKSKESSYLRYWDLNNLYGWPISQKFPVNDFKWVEHISKINEDFIKTYKDKSDQGYFFEVDIQYSKKLRNLWNDFPFLPKKMKIGKAEELLGNLYDKEEYVIKIRSLKQALHYGLALIKVHRSISFDQKAWLKPCTAMNTDLRKKRKNDFEKNIKLINNAVFGKTMKNVRKHRGIKFVTTETRKNYLVSEASYQTKTTTKFWIFISNRNEKNADTCERKIIMHEFWHDYVNAKYGEKAKLSYTDFSLSR